MDFVPLFRDWASGRPPGPPLPRPVLPRERGFMDRAVEYLVGDGPHNRFVEGSISIIWRISVLRHLFQICANLQAVPITQWNGASRGIWIRGVSLRVLLLLESSEEASMFLNFFTFLRSTRRVNQLSILQRPVAPRLQPMHLPASSQEEHSSSSDGEEHLSTHIFSFSWFYTLINLFTLKTWLEIYFIFRWAAC